MKQNLLSAMLPVLLKAISQKYPDRIFVRLILQVDGSGYIDGMNRRAKHTALFNFDNIDELIEHLDEQEQ